VAGTRPSRDELPSEPHFAHFGVEVWGVVFGGGLGVAAAGGSGRLGAACGIAAGFGVLAGGAAAGSLDEEPNSFFQKFMDVLSCCDVDLFCSRTIELTHAGPITVDREAELRRPSGVVCSDLVSPSECKTKHRVLSHLGFARP